jgi:serralysin
MTAQNWTLDQVLAQLNSGSHWTSSTITYSFPTEASQLYTGGGEGAGFSPLTNVQITYAEYALANWDDLIAPNFVQVASNSNIEFGDTTTGIDYAHAYYPKTGSAWFNPNYSDLANPTIGGYGFAAIMHELGHTLGLNHMGDYNGNDNSGPSSYQDSTVFSIMSYYGPDHYDGQGQVMWADWQVGGVVYSPQTPMLNDVMAVQAIYGADTTTRTGDTVYGFNSNITGDEAKIYNFAINRDPILTIYDAGGNDTLDLSGYATNSTIALAAGGFTHCNGMTYNIAVAYTATIENAIGGAGNDSITGNEVANRLTGNAGTDTLTGAQGEDVLAGGKGNDTLDGGDGTDTAVFSGAFANYTIRHNDDGSYTVTDNVGTDGQDIIRNVERLQFSDTLYNLGNSAPTLDHAIADRNATANQAFGFDFSANTFSDPDGDALTYSASLADGSDLPDWLHFDPSTRRFSGTPGTADIGTISIKVMASDGTLTASDTFDLDVGSGGGNPNRSPVAVDDSAETAESKSVLVDALANDSDPDGDSLTLVQVSVVSGDGTATIEDGKVRFAYTGAHLGTGESRAITLDYLVTDGTAQSTGHIQITVDGETDSNVVQGTAGADNLFGTAAAEQINGLAGRDNIHGRGGADTIDGGAGRDHLWGQAGADIFSFGNGNGRDDIMDFSARQGDRIDLSNVSGITGFQDLVQHHLYDASGSAYIVIDGKDDILIRNVNPNHLTEGNFIF